MKILMITMKMDIGGAETHILELCRELKNMGHIVTLLSNGGVYADALTAEGIEHIKLPFDRKTPSAVMTALRGLSRLLREREFDLVHAHARIPAFLCRLLRRRFGFRFVTTAHLNFSVNPLWRRLSDWGEQCMAVSGDIGDYLVREYGYDRDRIQLTINGIDTEKYSADTEYHSLLEEFGLPTDPDRRRLVYVSRLDADRADPAYRIVRIAEQLAEKIPNLDIIIGGGGTEYAAIRQMADAVNARAGRTLVTMTNNRPDVHRIAAAADVFVGVSRSALEAMAAEKPVILAGNQGSLGILDESNLAAGIATNFCCRGCPQATEETLLRDIVALFDEDEATRRARGAWGRQIILEQYTAARMARDYVAMYEKTLATPPPTDLPGEVIISGYYGFGNLGDDSLLVCIINSLRKLDPSLRITVLANKSDAMQKQFGVRCISRINLPAIAREMKGARLLISGGGSLLQDNTSTKSLIYYLHIIRMAKRQGLPVMLYANGIGPLYRPANRRRAARALTDIDCITLRDPDSLEELIALGVAKDNRITLTADPAFTLDPAPAAALEAKLTEAGFSTEHRYFAVSLRAWHMLGAAEGMLDEATFEEEIARAITRITEQTGLLPIILPMQQELDAAICRRLLDRAPEGSLLLDRMDAPSLCALLPKLSFAIGMRLHLLIYAAHMHLPAIGISYDPKIDACLAYTGQGKAIRPDHPFADELTERVLALLAHREAQVEALAAQAEHLTELAHKNAEIALALIRK